jgi:arylsulfatase A-like enzyme
MKINKLFVEIAALFTLFFCTSVKGQKTEKKNSKPNIVYILADDMGYFELSCYGGKVIETPNLDKLAQNGMIFSNHYCGSNICAPSRCALMTGKHTGHTWIRDNKELPTEGNEPIRASDVTVAQILKEAGYATGAFGKWGLGYPGSEGSPNKKGFDQFYGYNCQRHAHNYFTNYMRQNDDSVTLYGNLSAPYKEYSADVISVKALEFIDKNKNNPFFLYFASTLPHNPYNQPDDKILDYYTKKTGKPKGDPTSEAFSIPKYASMTARLDKEVGDLMAKLKALNLLENTLIIFTSDNGTALRPDEDEYIRTGGDLHGRKSEMYEGGIKSPMIAYWKGKIVAGSKSPLISAAWDFLPTVAELVKVKAPNDIDGISMLSTLLGKPKMQKEHDYLYWERNHTQGIRKGDMKAIVTYDKETKKPSVEIYNLAKDPYEKNNLAATEPQLQSEFLEIAKTARIESELFPLIKKGKKSKKAKDEENM